MSKWIIKDWAGSVIERGFDNFGHGIERVYELARIEADNNYKQDLEPEKWEELYEGVCEDLYVLHVDENDKEIEGDYTI